MAILNYGNQFKYSGKGYIDSKMAPVQKFEDLEKNVSTLASLYTPGMKVMVLNDEFFGPCEYYLTSEYAWKRVIDLDELSLSFDEGDFEGGDGKKEAYIQLNYKGEILGEPVNISSLLNDVESRLDALEEKGDVEDTNTFVESAEFVTEKDGENGLFIKFTYNDGNSFYTDITALEPKTYAQGVGILIGEDNVIGIDEAWFDEWFDAKVAELIERLDTIEAEVSEIKETTTSLSAALTAISGRVDAQDGEISTIKTNLSSALTQIAENKTVIEEVKAVTEETKAEVVTLAEKLAKIRGVELLKAGDNVSIVENESGEVVISATVPEVNLTPIEERLDEVEGITTQHTSDIAAIQEALKNITPEGEALSGDNETIKTNDNGFLSVMISMAENNILKKMTDGLFVQGVEMVLGDDEINVDENN
jgi:hypothetical protein